MLTYHPYTIFPLGDTALTIEFSNIIDREINKKVLTLFRQLGEANIPYITDLVPAYSSLTVHYRVSALHRQDATAFEVMAEMIENLTEERASPEQQASRYFEVPVCYEEKFAPDLKEVLEKKNISAEELISLHTEKPYHVYMLGFLPGFPYMGEVDEKLKMPRKEPRQVKAGSVAITGMQTGIYPFDTPGGWQVIGRTPLSIFNKEWTQPALFAPGDTIKFFSITPDEFEDYQRRNS